MDPAASAGTQLTSLILNCCLFGLLCAQVFGYHVKFPQDQLGQKLLVYLVFILETAQTVVIAHDRYGSFVLGVGDPLAHEAIRTTWFAVPLLDAIIGCIAQVSYAHRIHRFSQSKTLGAVILVLSIMQACIGVSVGVLAQRAKYFFHLRTLQSLVLTSTWLLSTVICDVLIAGTMTFFLLKFKRDFHQASPLFSKLILLSVETGIATASAAIVTCILFVVQAHSQSFDVPATILGKLYANSLMRVLNSRVRTENGYSEPFSTPKPEITTLPISYELGSVNASEACPGVEEPVRDGRETQRV